MVTNNRCGCGKPVTKCNCGSVCPVPTYTPSGEVTTLAEVLALIKTKCDTEVCDSTKAVGASNKEAIDALVVAVDALQVQVGSGEDIDISQYQRVSNMIDELDGDLDGKYPSAALLKEGLISLWQCMHTKNKHYGLWEDNVVIQTITPDTGCLIVDNDTTPTQKVQVPIGIGDTVVGADGCIYESLTENNTIEPTPEAVYDGVYRSNCSELDVLNCVIPKEGDTLCERVAALEALVVPEIGTVYTKSVGYYPTDTDGGIAFLDVVPAGKYIGHIQVNRIALTGEQMDDTNIIMMSNGGTTAAGYSAYLGQVPTGVSVDRLNAASIYSVTSNGVDPVKVVTTCASRFKGGIHCSLIRIA